MDPDQPASRSGSRRSASLQPAANGLSQTARRMPERRTKVSSGQRLHPASRQLNPDISGPVKLCAKTGRAPQAALNHSTVSDETCRMPICMAA